LSVSRKAADLVDPSFELIKRSRELVVTSRELVRESREMIDRFLGGRDEIIN